MHGVLSAGHRATSERGLLVPTYTQTVPAQMVTQMARPLPKQTVDKGKVWTVFIGGAVVLFLGTLAVENNPNFFPAISRANQAMKMATKRMQVRGRGRGRGRACPAHGSSSSKHVTPARPLLPKPAQRTKLPV